MAKPLANTWEKKLIKENIRLLLDKRTEIHPIFNCWMWTGSKNAPNGHGEIRISSEHGYKKKFYVHRLSAWIFYDYDLFSKEKQVNHKEDICPYRYCWNPEHIYIGTPTENAEDAIARGIQYGLSQILKTHCPRGHEYTEENTYHYKNERQCRQCKHEHYMEIRCLNR